MMAQMLEFAVNLSMLMSGNMTAQAMQASRSLSELGRKAQELQKMAGNISAFQKQRGAVEATRQKLVAARERVRQLREEYSKTDKPTASMRAAYGKAQADAGKLAEKLAVQQKALASLNSELVKSGVNTSRLIDEQNRLAANTDKVRAAQDRLTRAQENYSSLRSRFDWGNIKGDVISSMAMLKTFQAPVKVSMNYEQAMSQVKAVLNPTESEYRQLREQSLMLGRTTQFSAIQAANSQENLARGGMNTRQILGMMPTVLNVAASDGMEIAQAADIIAGAMRGFSLHDANHDTQREAARMGDILAYVSSHTSTNVAMAGAAMQAFSGTAFTQKISPEVAGAYIGVMANAGLQGTEASTSLERSIAALAERKGDTDKVLSEYRIATMTRSGGMRRLELVVSELFEKTAKKGEGAQLKAFMGVFGKAYGGDMLKFAQAIRRGELETLTHGVTHERDGSAASMARVRNDNLAGDLTALSSAWEGFMESVGNPLQDWSRVIVQNVTNSLSIVTDFLKKHEVLADIVVKIGAGFATWKIGATVLKYGELLVKLPAAWAEMKLAEHAAQMAVLGTNAGSVAVNMGGAAASAGVFGVSLSSALVTIGGIVAVSILIWQKWEKITEWCTKAGEALTSFDTGKISAAKAGTLSRSDAGYGVAVMSSAYMPPEIKPHATGGIMTRPHIGLVAEAGPEAIIPLTDKSRGIPLLMQAMNILTGGASSTVSNILTGGASSSVSNMLTGGASSTVSNMLTGGASSSSYSMAGGNSSSFSPTVNITVNASGNDTDIASRVKQAVIEALEELSSYRERVAYA